MSLNWQTAKVTTCPSFFLGIESQVTDNFGTGQEDKRCCSRYSLVNPTDVPCTSTEVGVGGVLSTGPWASEALLLLALLSFLGPWSRSCSVWAEGGYCRHFLLTLSLGFPSIVCPIGPCHPSTTVPDLPALTDALTGDT
uniref:Uncharacterized protein n=1 Tax=Ailuropoda melanoleuca TaxID=9646 RepID=A0A7N5PA79_AILME